MCTDRSLLSDAIYHAVDIAKKNEGHIDNFLILLCNSICFTHQAINKSLKKIKSDKADSVVTISKFNMFSPVRAMKIEKDKISNFIPNKV